MEDEKPLDCFSGGTEERSNTEGWKGRKTGIEKRTITETKYLWNTEMQRHGNIEDGRMESAFIKKDCF